MYFDDIGLEAPEQFTEWLALHEADPDTSDRLQSIGRLIERSTGIGADLTDKQHAFALEYARTFNATQSAVTAGYSTRTAAQMGYKLRRNPKLVRLIDAESDRQLAADDACSLTLAEKIQFLMREVADEQQCRLFNIINADIREVFNAIVTNPHQLPVHIRDAVLSIKRSKGGNTLSVTLQCKIRALTALTKILGMTNCEDIPLQVQSAATYKMIS